MPFSLLPKIMTRSVTDLTPTFLHQQNICLLMLDFDNTVVPYTTDTPTPQMLAWLEEMTASDIQLCVVSNSHKDRVKIFCKNYGLDCITHAKKPFSKGIKQCLERYQMPQPSKPRGNIYCEEDKDEYVIGHIGCSSGFADISSSVAISRKLCFSASDTCKNGIIP